MSVPTNFPPMPIHRNVCCPKCNIQMGFSVNIVNQKVTCPSCNESFDYYEGLMSWLAMTPADILLLIPIRMGVIQIQKILVKIGQVHQIKLQNPLYKIFSATLSSSKQPDVTGLYYDDGDVAAYPVVVSNDSVAVLSSKKNSSSETRNLELTLVVTGMESDERVPIWLVFLQDSIDLINKQEHGAAIVVMMMALDAFLADIITNKLKERSFTPDFIRKTALSNRFGRESRLTIWLEELYGKSFTESGLNNELKSLADLRNRIVHPALENFDEKTLTLDIAQNSLGTVIKSMKWVSDLVHNRLGRETV